MHLPGDCYRRACKLAGLGVLNVALIDRAVGASTCYDGPDCDVRGAFVSAIRSGTPGQCMQASETTSAVVQEGRGAGAEGGGAWAPAQG